MRVKIKANHKIDFYISGMGEAMVMRSGFLALNRSCWKPGVKMHAAKLARFMKTLDVRAV